MSGSSTVLPISNLVAELFAGQNPDVQVSVDGPGTGDGFVLFCKGETDISDASRPIEDDEKAACSDAGIDYVELAVAFDGITVMTNPENSAVTCLNSGDLYALFGPQSEGIDTWNGADSLAKKVGGNGGFPDAPLEITAPGAESGTYDAFIELSGIEDIALEQGVSEDEAATLRPDYQSSPDDNVIIQAMEGSAERARVRRLRVRRGGRGPDQDHPGRRWQRLRRADPGHDRGRFVPAVADALHLRQHGEGREQPGVEGVRRPLPVRRRSEDLGRAGRLRRPS